MKSKLTYIQIERERKKITKIFIVRLTGEWKKKQFWKILENFGYFLEFFGKLTFFETSMDIFRIK